MNNNRFMLLLLHFESPLVSLLQVDKKEEEKKERKGLKCVHVGVGSYNDKLLG
jgi:hypothetical protein